MKLATILNPIPVLLEHYALNKIKRDSYHKYQSCDGVMYQLSNTDKDRTISIDDIEATPENSFYEDMIERYMRYIQNGGIIETFPVTASRLAYNLEDMFEFLDGLSYKDSLDSDADSEIFSDSPTLKDNQYSLYEIFDKYPTLNTKAREISQCFSNPSPEEKQLLPELELVFTFFNEHSEYTLTDMNHRFEAVRRLNIKTVIAEIV